jgi:hypothetical protein
VATPSIDQLTVRRASQDDAPAILSIQAHWLERGEGDQRHAGYLSGGAHTAAEISQLIEAHAVVVAVHEGSVIGYYLFDDITNQHITAHNRESLRSLPLPFRRVCPRAQAAVLEEFHHLGLSRLLVRHLMQEHKGRFDAVFASVAKDNPKLAAHLRVGWRLAGEDGQFFYVVLPLNDADEQR